MKEKNNVAIVGFIFSILSILSLGVLSSVGLVLSIIAFFISKNYKKGLKGLALAGIIISSICFAYFWIRLAVSSINSAKSNRYTYSDYETNTDYNNERDNTESKEKVESDKKDEKKNSSGNLSAISNAKLRDNFIKACSDIHLDYNKIKDLKKKDDWNSGPRYTFYYNNSTFILYALDNGDVSSITIANGLYQIYLDGYEPLNVNDYIFALEDQTTLSVKAQEKIKEYLYYPSTAKFGWTGYSYVRQNDIYQINGTFKAKNALNAEIDHNFKIEFKKENGDFTIVYLNVNGEKYIGTETHLKEIERKEIQVQEQKTEDNSIVLKEGQMGSYGRKDKFDGDEYIRYYIPAGTYKVEALTKNANFFIETIALHKEDGWDTATTIQNIKLSKTGDTTEFSISGDQCIMLVMHTQIKLTKIN